MKKEYSTEQLIKIVRPKNLTIAGDIYTEVEETIAEHKTIMQQWEILFQAQKAGARSIEKDIYDEVEETLAEHRRVMRHWDRLLEQEQNRDHFILQEKEAA